MTKLVKEQVEEVQKKGDCDGLCGAFKENTLMFRIDGLLYCETCANLAYKIERANLKNTKEAIHVKLLLIIRLQQNALNSIINLEKYYFH